MKLTKMQASALASKLCKEICDEVRKREDKINKEVNSKIEERLLKNKKYQKAKEYLQFIEDLVKENPVQYEYNSDSLLWEVKNTRRRLEDRLKNSLRSRIIKDYKFTAYPSKQHIENDLIIQTIDSKDLDSVIESIRKKYMEITR